MTKASDNHNSDRVALDANAAVEIELTLRRKLGEALSHANADLEKRVRERTAELQHALASLESERERERERLARDLHDDLGHLLSCLRLELDLVHSKMQTGDLDASHALLDRVIASTRGIVAGLRPKVLDDQGLRAAIENLVQSTGARYGLDAHADIDPNVDQFDPSTAVDVFRLLQEAINNVLKHAQAKRLQVTARSKPDWIVFEVRDDGRGLPQGRATSGFGLISMRERASQLDGDFSVRSETGQGTVVTVSLPVAPGVEKRRQS